MAFNTELITSANIVTECIPDATFDVERLDKFIFLAQLNYLETAVGETLYETLLSETPSYSGENQLLFDNFIKPMLCWFTLYDALPFIRNNITPAGIMVNTTEFQQQSSKEDYAGVRNACSVRGERYKGQMAKYVRDIREGDSSAFSTFSTAKDKHQNSTGFITYRTKRHNHDDGRDHYSSDSCSPLNSG